MSRKKIKKAFFIRFDRLGEFILSLPAIKLFRDNYKDSEIYLMARRENIDIIRGVDFIDYFIEFKDDYFRGQKGIINLIRLFKKEQIDCVVNFVPKKEFHLASFIAGVPLRVGYNRKWGFCLNRKIQDRKFLCEKHEVEYNIDLMRLICHSIFIPKIDIPVENITSRIKHNLRLGLKEKYIVIHPFSSSFSKKAPFSFWMRLVDRFRKILPNIKIVVIGAKYDEKESEQFVKYIKIESLVGQLNLKDLMGFLVFNCMLFIGLDSGPMHLASVLNIPVVGVFRTTNPQRWGPFNNNSLIVKISSSTETDFSKEIDDIVSFAKNNIFLRNSNRL